MAAISSCFLSTPSVDSHQMIQTVRIIFFFNIRHLQLSPCFLVDVFVYIWISISIFEHFRLDMQQMIGFVSESNVLKINLILYLLDGLFLSHLVHFLTNLVDNALLQLLIDLSSSLFLLLIFFESFQYLILVNEFLLDILLNLEIPLDLLILLLVDQLLLLLLNF